MKTEKTSKNQYSPLTNTFIRNFYNKEALYKAAVILDQGQFKDAKKVMSLDSLMAAAVALYDLKDLFTQKEKEQLVQHYSVYDIVNLAYHLKLQEPIPEEERISKNIDKTPNYFSEIKKCRDSKFKPNIMKHKLEKSKSLDKEQKMYFEAQMLDETPKKSLERRLNSLSYEAKDQFKKMILHSPREYCTVKEMHTYARMYPEDHLKRYIVEKDSPTNLARIILRNLQDPKPKSVRKNKPRISKEAREECKQHYENSLYDAFNIPEEEREFVDPKDLEKKILYD